MASTDSGFGARLSQLAQRKGISEVAVAYGDSKLTWQELETVATRRSHDLAAAGVSADDLVGIAMPNGVEHHEWAFATWKCGATPLILPPKLPGHEVEQLLATADPRVVVGSLSETNGVMQLDPFAPPASSGIGARPDRAARYFKAVASGGSTGRPKVIVARMPSRYDAGLRHMIDTLRIPHDGMVLNPGPLYHNAPFLFSNLALLAGSTVVGMLRFDAEECLRLIERHKVSWVCLVPTMMHRIWALPEAVRNNYDLSSLQSVWHMAAACPVWLKRAWIDWLGPERIFELYGGTEGMGTVIGGGEWLEKPGSVGQVQPGSIVVLDDKENECAAGEVGEIYLAAATIDAFHYLGAEPKCSADGRLSLGDLGHIDADGYLFLADRRTDLILRGGANIYPAEIEAVLDTHPLVMSSVVIGLPSDEYGQRPHAIVERDPGSPLSPDDLNRFVRDRLAGFKCPESYEFADQPLRDDAGKVRRSQLRAERLDWIETGRVFQESLFREAPGAAHDALAS